MNRKQITKRCLLIGVGLAAHARDRSEKLVKELVKKNHISTAEGKKLVSKIYQEAEKSGKKVAKLMESELKKTIKIVKGSVKKKK